MNHVCELGLPTGERGAGEQVLARTAGRLSPAAALRRKVGNVPQPPSQQAAADAVYHQFLQSLTSEQLDFVRGQRRTVAGHPCTSTNKTAENHDKPRKKGDWHTQRSGFIKQVFLKMVFLKMHADSEVDEDTLLDVMFDGGKYDWLKDTTRVIRAVQARYNDNTRAKAFTALFQLCEVKCGAYLAESCIDEEYNTAKMVYVDRSPR